jgi:purine nucleoside permease
VRRPGFVHLLAALLIAALSSPALAAPAHPTPIKVVVLTTFEPGADTGDRPGEFQFWVERYPLPRTIKVPGIERPLRYSKDGVLGVVTDTRARARESVAALALDPRFDLSHAYWLVAGIAGVDPRAGSIGSAAWARWVVDADPDFEMDDRDIPADWPYGLYSLGTGRPGVKGAAPGASGMVWKLNPGLVDWAFGLTRGVELPDSALLQAARARYPSEPAAQLPPHVFLGEALGTTRFWHGERRTIWARDWVKLWTDGQGVFAMTDCEDQGVLDVLSLYARSGRVDLGRVLVLRTASNYSREGDGADPVLKFTDGGALAGFEAAWRVGAPVVKALVAGWPRYQNSIPGIPAP